LKEHSSGRCWIIVLKTSRGSCFEEIAASIGVEDSLPGVCSLSVNFPSIGSLGNCLTSSSFATGTRVPCVSAFQELKVHLHHMAALLIQP
jgi:hypothetical protein